MTKSFVSRLGIIVGLVIAVLLGMVFSPAESADALGKPEYKFVRLADDGAMPVISEALNVEVERGYELHDMEVGDGTIYLVFVK